MESYEKVENTKTDKVNAIKSRNKEKSKRERLRKYDSDEKRTSICTRCGTSAHLSQEYSCPAKKKKCNSCGKLGHFQRCCRTKFNQQKRK